MRRPTEKDMKHLATTPLCAPLAASLLAGLTMLAPAPARADAVTEWNEIGVRATPGPPPPQIRIMAIMHIAMHDALNAIQPRYRTYTAQPPAAAGASPPLIWRCAFRSWMRWRSNSWHWRISRCLDAACSNVACSGGAARSGWNG